METKLGERAVAALLVLGVGWHTAATWLFNAPRNAIGAALHAPVTAYMHPYFVQRWNFFAPSPASADVYTFARARDRSGRISPWIDVTSTLQARRDAGFANDAHALEEALSHASRDAAAQNVRGLVSARELVIRTSAMVLNGIAHRDRYVEIETQIRDRPLAQPDGAPLRDESLSTELTFPWRPMPDVVEIPV